MALEGRIYVREVELLRQVPGDWNAGNVICQDLTTPRGRHGLTLIVVSTPCGEFGWCCWQGRAEGRIYGRWELVGRGRLTEERGTSLDGGIGVQEGCRRCTRGWYAIEGLRRSDGGLNSVESVTVFLLLPRRVVSFPYP